MRDYIRDLEIKECRACEEIRLLQNAHDIAVAPLFWQGEGKEDIPLVIMGINPSPVKTSNEPQTGCNFDTYFNYYQDRNISEEENKRIARATGRANEIPVRYWSICHNLAKKFVGDETPRWKDYILMEAIHCFYAKESDLGPEDSRNVARRCFDNHTKSILMRLKPRKLIFLGKSPYELFLPYLERALSEYDYCALQIENLRIPVMRHPHPRRRGQFYNPEKYRDFLSYCREFDYAIANRGQG